MAREMNADREETRPLGTQEARGSRIETVKLIVIIGGLSAFAPLSIDMYLPALPSLTHDLGGSASLVQLTLTSCLLGLAVGQLVAGPLSDAFGRRRPLLLGLAGYTVASLLCAQAPSVLVLVLLRFIQGAAGAAGIVISRAVVRDLYEGTDLARFFGLTMVVNGLAPILAPVFGGQLLRVTSWRGVFLVLAAIGAALLLTSAFGLPETLPRERRRSGGIGATLAVFRAVMADRVFAGYALCAGFTLGAMFAYIAGSPFVLEDIYGVSAQTFGLFFGSIGLGITIFGVLSGHLVERVHPRTLLVIGLAVVSAGVVLLLATVILGLGLIGLAPALFLVVATLGLVQPIATALALADHAEQAGSASALLGLLSFVFGAAVAPLVGIGGSHTAVPMVVLIAVLDGAGILIFVLLTRPVAVHAPAAPARS